MSTKIAIIEDNVQLVEFITEFLKTQGDFQIKAHTSGAEALKSLKLNKPDIVLLDLGLEDIRGETICVELRKLYPELPIIILTGDNSKTSLVNTLNSGADDYITKPFDAAELLARIQARLRQTNNQPNNNLLTCQDLTVDLNKLEVTRSGKKIELTAKEFDLLKYLMVNKSRILTRDKILDEVWGYSVYVDTRVVDVHVGKLRKKLETGFKGKLLETIRGFGYKMNC